MSETITISKDEYYNLKCSEAKLTLLECGGVDNWEGYCDSLNNSYGDMDESLEEIRDRLFNEIFGAETCHAQ